MTRIRHRLEIYECRDPIPKVFDYVQNLGTTLNEIVQCDGTAIGIWVCGACNQLLLILWRIDERKSSGQYDWAHGKCIPKYEHDSSHPSMAIRLVVFYLFPIPK